MKRSEAARYARWSALAALSLAAITGVIYLRRQWIAHVEIKKAPPPLAADQERQSIGLTLSKGEGDRTIFTVHASKSTDLRGQDISLLEDVEVTVFGKLGDRHDVLHTQSCRYAKTNGSILCSGAVQMELQSAEDAKRAKERGIVSVNVIHIFTSRVTFQQKTGQAETAEPVKFSFANGEGEGVGAVYLSEEGRLRLQKDVRVTLEETKPLQPGKKQAPPATEVILRGSSMEMGKKGGKVELYGPATATTSTHQLSAGILTMLMDDQNRAQTLIAEPGNLNEEPVVKALSEKGAWTLSADKLTADLAPEGWVHSVEGEGNLRGSEDNGDLQADTGNVEMWPGVNQAKLITLRGNVLLNARDAKTGSRRKLVTSALQLSLGGGRAGEPNPLQHGETLDRGTAEWNDTAGAQSRVSGDKLTVDFGAKGKAQDLVATGNVETQRELTGSPTQTATAAAGNVQMDGTGQWSQMAMHGNVHMKQGVQSAEAEQAVFVRTPQTAVLTGRAVARDASSETRATKITFHQGTGDVEAEGKVRSTDLGEKKSTIELSPAPANITADHMVGNSKTNRALYTGHARLWQGPSVLEADSIELLKDARVLNAKGNVRGVFPEVSSDAKEPKEAKVRHISSGTLTYWDAENRAHLEKNVVVQSPDGRMRSPLLELYFVRSDDAKNGSEGTAQIDRAVGTGGVMVEQGDRRGTAEKGVYTAADDKFVLSGGTPTLYDVDGGITTGRELTFNNADDTIIVDSGNGTRTLSKHRVQK